MTTPGRWRSLGSEARHAPVLTAEVVSMLSPRPGGVYVDCTVGLGGHAAALLAAGAGRVIGLDRDAGALDQTRERLAANAASTAGRLELVHADYRDLASVLETRGITAVDGVLADLGVSSWQLDDASRGFSFRNAGPLDMRMDRSRGRTLGEWLASVDEPTLAGVIRDFGEERHARRVAAAIVRARDAGRLSHTAELASVVRRAAGSGRWQRIDPATRTFQALRIAVNDELTGLDTFLERAVASLKARARLVVIAFHSLEDRVVKQTFRRLATAGTVSLVTRRPLTTSDEEIALNPRARSARLRTVERAA
ncbi:MAG TPA: 16S rRNA (cytosine(1402)-N(4))-methyltransferase RsmH [Vicinamibacterales bacterium]|nr:16S rRNA (cytosine(1402)-N(4))-methyltransferase RsmH [Vicinamibacterales bacterium]